MTEAQLLAEIRLAVNQGPNRLFRQNTGQGWTGIVVDRNQQFITLKDYRPFHAGLCVGSSDFIGWSTRNGVAVFTALEAKSARGRVSNEQQMFIDAVRKAGGIAGAVRSVDEARLLLATSSPARPD